ncbi:pentapeptide repeat-containing protein [Streptomyces sp. NPDC127084]|uniref:pentapeptide repeat-containing protein n=1 Tax=Streptomyces sp. NPDC127084 TaxID=3347133 RepID=UPI00364BB45F
MAERTRYDVVSETCGAGTCGSETCGSETHATDTRGTPDTGGVISANPELRADCGSCFGLCCAALPFAASADFAVGKPAGQPCTHLGEDFRCGIHDRLRERGFPGCTVYDCFGAGQKVSQVTFGGVSWRQRPDTAQRMFAVFPVLRQLHELLRHLAEAVELPAARSLHAEIRRLYDDIDTLTRQEPATLLGIDVPALRARTGDQLLRVSALVRAEAKPGRKKDRRGADLFGARLAGADLRGADLRGACLIAADLTSADLRLADLLGADLRDADLSGADLTGSVFVTQPQLQQGKGDARTRIPRGLTRPAHWSA